MQVADSKSRHRHNVARSLYSGASLHSRISDLENYDRRAYKQFRSLRAFEKYYTQRLFHTVIMYPHEESIQRLRLISESRFKAFTRKIVLSLPFFCPTLRTSCGRSTILSNDLSSYCQLMPAELPLWLQSFNNLQSIVILPPWLKRREWLDRHEVRKGGMHELLAQSWFGCRLNHYECERNAEAADTAALRSVLRILSSLQPRIRRLHVFHLGTEWLDLAAGSWDRVDTSDFFGMSPRASVDLMLNNGLLEGLDVSSCTLHDCIWFVPIFCQLRKLSIHHFHARHSTEVELFAMTINGQLYPKLVDVRLLSSDLLPRDYLFLFKALRDHGRLDNIQIETVHRGCLQSTAGAEFRYATNSEVYPPECAYLVEYFHHGRNDIDDKWLSMFRHAGETLEPHL